MRTHVTIIRRGVDGLPRTSGPTRKALSLLLATVSIAFAACPDPGRRPLPPAGPLPPR